MGVNTFLSLYHSIKVQIAFFPGNNEIYFKITFFTYKQVQLFKKKQTRFQSCVTLKITESANYHCCALYIYMLVFILDTHQSNLIIIITTTYR